MKAKHFLGAAWVIALVGCSFGLHREANHREQLVRQRQDEFRRIQEDQPDLEEVRSQVRKAQAQQDLNQELHRQAAQQALLLEKVARLPWTHLEWERDGFYLESPGAESLRPSFPRASYESERCSGLWP
jgi:hypothetical protein